MIDDIWFLEVINFILAYDLKMVYITCSKLTGHQTVEPEIVKGLVSWWNIFRSFATGFSCHMKYYYLIFNYHL